MRHYRTTQKNWSVEIPDTAVKTGRFGERAEFDISLTAHY